MNKPISVTLAVILGLAVGEIAANVRDNGGFPHYNGYVADAALGVRLEPDFDTVLAFKENPPGPIHVNASGYRGADWPEGRTGEIAVIGDSQVFGLGVADHETLPAQLEAATGVPTLNLGVPTYGPPEYLALIDEVAPRRPSVIVMVVNFANDLFEINIPNTQRHVVLDGWAVRGDTVPDRLNIPGRSWLFQHSHLVLAARTLLHAEGQPEDAATPGAELPTPAPAERALALSDINQQIAAAVQAQETAERAVIAGWLSASGQPGVPNWAEVVHATRGGARVGDIVERQYEESSVRIQLTAEWLSDARKLRREAPAGLAAWVKAHPTHPQAEGYGRSLARLSAASAELERLAPLRPSDGGRPSDFRGFLLDARGRAQRAGAELVVLALPLDVQVDPAEFKKYGAAERDMSESLGLLDDLCADARHLGLRCDNPTAALRAGNPGMFLDGDIHLTAAGQKRVAEGLARTLGTPAPAPTPTAGLPEGRSRLPTDEEWSLEPEVFVKCSSKSNCSTQRLREYLRVVCKAPITGLVRDGAPYVPSVPSTAQTYTDVPWDAELRYGAAPLRAKLVTGPLDHLIWNSERVVGLIVPLLPGREVVADFVWADRVERLTVPPGPVAEGQPLGAFEPAPPVAETSGAAEIAADCGPDQLRGGAVGACLDVCSPTSPCAAGSCTDWLGLNLCI